MMSRVRPVFFLLLITVLAIGYWLVHGSSLSPSGSAEESRRLHRGSRDHLDVDNSFWTAGLPEDDTIEESGNKEVVPADDKPLQAPPPTIPINPRTKQPFTEAELKIFDELRQRFPRNRMIPHVRNQEEIDEAGQREAELDIIYAMMDRGKASVTEVNRYYDEMKKTVDERIEILTYLRTEKKNSYDESRLKAFDRLIAMNRERLGQYQTERETELKRADAAGGSTASPPTR